MENAAEALKIAFAVLLFVLALTLSISSFSQATRAVGVITTLRDREAQYTYVKPINSENDFSRIVGIETVVSTIYRAPEQNLKIYFFESDGETPIPLYYATDTSGELKYDSTRLKIEMSYIDLATGFNKTNNSVEDFINALLGGIEEGNLELEEKYGERLIYNEGLYEEFANAEFLELLGEYEENEGASQITQRIITFIKQ